MIRHLLNSSVTVYRPGFTPDGRGGRTRSTSSHGTLRARISQPSAAERATAGQMGSVLDAIVHVEFNSDVERGDELDTGDTRRLRVVSVVNDSARTYKRLDCQAIQGE